MSDSRYPLTSPAATDASSRPGQGTSLQASVTVTGSDGTILVTVSGHTEPSAPGSGRETALVVVDVAGDIDADTAPLLHTVLTDAINRYPRVCCDLSHVAFLGAAAVNTLLAALRSAEESGCHLIVRGVHGFNVRVFEITGLDAVLASRA